MTISLLLGPADEILLARRIEAGLLAAELIARTDFSRADPAELRLVQRQGQQAWQRFLLANVRLVQSLAVAEARRWGAAVEELFQEGFVGLAEALRRWDFAAGYRFSTYATPWVRRRIQNAGASQPGAGPGSVRTALRARRVRALADELTGQLQRGVTDDELSALLGRSAAWVGRMRIAQPCAVIESDFAAQSPTDDGDDGAAVVAMIRRLPADERAVVRHRYGIGTATPANQRDAAAALGVSLSTLRRHEARALRRLRGWLESERAA